MDDKEYFNLCKMLLLKSGSEVFSFTPIINTMTAMKGLIKSQKKKIEELEQQLNDRATDRDRAFDEMYSRATKAEERVKELEKEVKILETRCTKFKELVTKNTMF
jgi:hypothetical protein